MSILVVHIDKGQNDETVRYQCQSSIWINIEAVGCQCWKLILVQDDLRNQLCTQAYGLTVTSCKDLFTTHNRASGYLDFYKCNP